MGHRVATVAPFRGVRYDTARIGDLRRVVAPPYDVISAAQLADLRARSPYNIVHLDLPNAEGRADENPYTEAGRRFRAWLSDGILRHDARPAIYAYHQRYRVPGTGAVRELRGFIAAVRLARWDEGVILPHEHTFAKPKEDRLRLMRASQANLSPVYGFYFDPGRAADEALESATQGSRPHVAVRDDDGAEHTMWAVDRPDVLRRVADALAAHKLYIADGHHRYETALDYRDEMRRQAGQGGTAGYEYVMMMLVNADAGGLTVLPTHRMVRVGGAVDRAAVRERLEALFAVAEFDVAGADAAADRLAALIADQPNKMALVWPDRAWVLTVKDPAAVLAAIEDTASDAWKLLGATILHRVVLEKGLGMAGRLQADGEHITYTRDAQEAVRAAVTGACDLACLLNAPGPAEIRAVAEAGDAMPHKSTYFYPKLLTGLVMNDLSLPVGGV